MFSRAEKHPFGNFVPSKSRYLLLGSFTARQAVEGKEKSSYDWFYGTKRNQFWPIIEEVYGLQLPTKTERQDLFTRLGMAVTDIILECERRANNNSDLSLKNIVFNTEAIHRIVRENQIEAIYFTSRFVEELFRREFRDHFKRFSQMRLVTLPSPSPRYAKMTRQMKVLRYKELLPRFMEKP